MGKRGSMFMLLSDGMRDTYEMRNVVNLGLSVGLLPVANRELLCTRSPSPACGRELPPGGSLGARGKITYRATDFRGARYEAPSGRGLREAVGEPAYIGTMIFFRFFKPTAKPQFEFYSHFIGLMPPLVSTT